MPSHFADGMVLQTWNDNHMAAKLYGLAKPGELVNATTDQKAWPWLATIADPVTGAWSLAFNLPPGAGTAGFTLTVTGNESSTSPLVYSGVKWGDVYACIGDSSVLLPTNASDGGADWLYSSAIQTLLKNKNLMFFAANAAQADTPQADFTPAGTTGGCSWPGTSSSSSPLPCNAWTQATNETALSFSALCLQTVASLLTLSGGNPGNNIVGVVQLAAPYAPLQSLLPPWANTSACPPLAADPSPPSGLPPSSLPAPSSYFNGLVNPIAQQTWRGYVLSTAGSDWSSVANSTPGAYACALAAFRDGLGQSPAVGDIPLLFSLASPALAVAAGADGDALFAFQREQQAILPRSGGAVTTSAAVVVSNGGTNSLLPLSGPGGQPVGPAAPTETIGTAHRLVLPMAYMGFWRFGTKAKGPAAVAATAAGGSSAATTTVAFAFAPDSNTTLPFLALLPAPGCTLCCGGASPSAVVQVVSSASGPWTNATFTVGPGNATLIVTVPAAVSSSSVRGAGAAGAPPSFVRYGAADPASPQCFLVDNTTGLLAAPFLLPITAAAAVAVETGVSAAPPAAPSRPVPPSSDPPVPEALLSSAHLIADDGTFSRRDYLLHGRERARAFARRIARGAGPLTTVGGGASSTSTPAAVIAPTPPLGYNTWQAARCNLDELVLLRVGRALVSSGLRDLGFVNVNTDDCVMRARLPSNGSLTEDETRFPSTLFNLVAGLRAMGLGFGVYTSQTSETCTGRPASYEMEDVDTARWCEWACSFVKVDNCGGTKYPSLNTSWIRIREGLAAHCGADNSVVLSVETCGDPRPSGCGGWIRSVGAQMWRTTGDLQLYWSSVLSNLDGNEVMAPLAGPGRYNDPDMLILGHAGLTFDEARSHWGGWAISAAPLLLSFDLANPTLLTAPLLALISNPEVLAVDQDAAVVQGVRVTPPNATGTEVWAKPLTGAGGDATAVFAFNRQNEGAADVYVDFSVVAPGVFPSGSGAAHVRDLWAREDLGVFTGGFVAAGVAPHASRMLLVTPVASRDAESAPLGT
jgi:hypothetical protein